MLPTRIEIVPTDDIVTRVHNAVPLDTTLTITCLPHHGVRRTMQTAIQLRLLGYSVVPHLAARSLQDRSELASIIRDCEVAGINEVFAVGGDAPEAAGPYGSSLHLVEDIAEFSGGRIGVGIAGYPEGHPGLSALHLVDSLVAKHHLATHLVTQMCFSAPKILDYAALLRREGVELPVWAGVAGILPKGKLVSLATKIGVGTSLKFLSRQGPLGRRLLSGGRYSPRDLIAELSEPPVAVEGIHLYSFNDLATLASSAASKIAGTFSQGALHEHN
ncbi:methylenetetrahydrofolate reductase [Arthrobacter sp. NicSoilB8]|uniref:methylenetetrahydrofolate reductase n=1 Tax=Arthrobacter sp. NicSoilB8 TaxID=2830998 RepID=UPI001CC596D8|nr:methylenetetrahydrofolate reductase [Arthrobacter sp. NicSoilB8]BCW73574.1 methylenetetrahydrofolate reductase [Arthrobacter sp. NicSoilB8]